MDPDLARELDLPTERLERSVTLDTSLDRAWDLLTAPDHLTGWLGAEVDLTPVAGTEGSVVDHDGTRRRVVVDDVRPGERIAWHWWVDGSTADPQPTRVEITLTPAASGTRIDVVEHRLPGPPAASAAVRGAGSGRVSATTASVRWGHRLLHLELLALVLVAVRA